MLRSNIASCISVIRRVAVNMKVDRWAEAANDLEFKIAVKKMPFWWPTYWMKSVYATTVSEDLIYVTKLWLTKPMNLRCAVLVHEWVHTKQYASGRLSWVKYLFNKSVRDKVEEEGYKEQTNFMVAFDKIVGIR